MAKEFEGSATGGTFSPNKTLQLGDNSKENEQRFASTLSDYGRIVAANDATHVENARKQVQGWNDLAKFSKTLTNKLVKDKQQENLAEYEAGIADAYMNGIPKDEADDFDQKEAAVNAVGQETDALGAEFAEASGSRAEGERISASSGWRALGRATGLAKQGAAMYPMFMAQNAMRLADASTPEEYAATLQDLRKEYLGQFGGMNRAMMAKYMFPKMQELEGSQFLSWQKKNNEMIMNDRVESMGSDFYNDIQIGQGGQGFVDFLEKNKHFLGGYGNARKKLFEIIQKGINNGTMTREDAEALRSHSFNFNGKETTLGRQFGQDFDSLEDKFKAEDAQNFNQRENERKIKANEIVEGIRAWRAQQGGKLSEAQKQEMLELWDPRLGEPPTELKNMLTQEDVDQESMVQRLEAKIQAGYPITEADLDGLDADNRRTYGNVAKGSGKVSSADSYIKSLVSEKTEELDGDTAKTPRWEQMYANAQLEFKQMYQINLKSMSPEDALNDAKARIQQRISSGGLTSEIPKTGAAKDKQNLAAATGALSKDPQLFNTTTIPGTEDALKGLQMQLEKPGGKTPEIPQIYHTLASGIKGVSGFDLANQQLKLNGLPPLIPPKAEQYPDSIPPEVRELFKYKPTPARAMRAGNVIEYITGDRSHEGYAADHGGSNYHEHIAFDSPETTQAAIDLLESNNIYVGSRNDGKHADTSYHYTNQAFDVPLYPNLERFGLPDNRDGEEQFSAMVRDLLGKNGFGGAGIRASRTQPVSASHKQFLDFIAADESNGDYEAFNTGGSNYGHTAHGSGYGNEAASKYGKPLTQMTVGEVVALGNSGAIHAAGRYQIINKTLKGLVKNYNIDPNALYDEEMQDQLALKLAYQRLVRGNAITGLRNEWVSLQHIGADRIRSSLGRAFNNPELLLKGV